MNDDTSPPGPMPADRETPIRREQVESALAGADWGQEPGSRIQRDFPVTVGGTTLHADYLLLHHDQPLALVQVFPAGLTEEAAVAQACSIAAEIGIGWVFVYGGGGDALRVAVQSGRRERVSSLPGPDALWQLCFGDREPPPHPMFRMAAGRTPAPKRGRPTPPEPLLDALLGVELPAIDAPALPPDALPPEPVWLAARAAAVARPGERFTASVAAYVAPARDTALRQLAALGEEGDRQIEDLAPQGDAHWRVGAPVSVRLSGEGFTVTPEQQPFLWSGRFNAVAFDVLVHADAAAGKATLWCHVAVAGVTMAELPLRVAIGAVPAAPAEAPPPTELRLPRTVFASYSSADADEVGLCLSALAHFTRGVDVFQDCLDLHPGDAFKPQLSTQIGRREAFLLFWSRHAAASPWVRWEYETARDTLGLKAIVPMPLEDPEIAPPPAELAGLHLRDRYLLARYARRQIRDEAAAPVKPAG